MSSPAPCRCAESYLGGGQLSDSPAAAERVGSGPRRHPAARLQVDGGRLQRLRARHLLSVDACGHHGNGRLGRHHGDGDALAGRLDEGQRLGGPHGAASDSEFLWAEPERRAMNQTIQTKTFHFQTRSPLVPPPERAVAPPMFLRRSGGGTAERGRGRDHSNLLVFRCKDNKPSAVQLKRLVSSQEHKLKSVLLKTFRTRSGNPEKRQNS